MRVQINPVAFASMGLSIEDIRKKLSMKRERAERRGRRSGTAYVVTSNDQLLGPTIICP